MRISLNWLKKYVDIKIPNEDLVRLIGARLVEVEEVIDESKKYDNIFVVKVIECEKIPETHLSLCKIDNGSEEIQVVCGAPNVHAGMLAAWIAPGAIVPQSIHEDAPFVIGKRKMLGKFDSFGMLAGADELDFGDDHSGIVEIDPETAKPGDKLADVFELNDIILDIENKSLTHRPDCFGLIGFAREVAGILGQRFIDPGIFKTIDESHSELIAMIDSEKSCQLAVDVQDSAICPFYSAAVLDFTRVPTTKKYLTIRDTILSKAGMRPIDPIVDLTNYIMLLTGQPLHAFDYDKFIAVGNNEHAKISVRLASPSEKLILLDDSEVELNENDIIITSNNIPVALAGAMGGKNTAIDESTKRIILESATFSLYNLRKTQMSHGIFSEAITRFTKGQPAANCLPVLLETVKNLGGKIFALALENSEAIANHGKTEENVVKITTEEINGLLGTKYDEKLIKTTLENVGFEINDKFEVKAPAWRTDIHIKEDIIEEVGRLLGYDNINPILPLHTTANKNRLFELKSKIRNVMKQFGANETLTYSFISEKLLEKAGQDPKNSYKIINSISPELQYIRQSLVPSLLEKAYMNLKIPYDSFVLFEMNKVYQKNYGLDEDGVPVDHNRFAIVVADRKRTDTAYYTAKMYAEKLLGILGVECSFGKLQASEASNKILEPKRSAEIYSIDNKLGMVGELKMSVSRNFKLPKFVAVAELDLDTILSIIEQRSTNLSREMMYNRVERDLTISTSKEYALIYNKISEVFKSKDLIARISPTSIYQPNNNETKNLSFHLEFSDKNKTLESSEINALMSELEKIQ